MFKEDLSDFFDTDDFAVKATFGAKTFPVIFNKPDTIIAGGDVISADYEITYRAADAPVLKLDDKVTIECEGDFYVNEPTRVQDGAVMKCTLRKAL